MEDFSLYVLDIVMNSVRAGADEIQIFLSENGNWLDFTVRDNGCGMTKEQLARATDPFFTTRTTRRVGLGLSLFRALAEMTDGTLQIVSKNSLESDTHGTEVTARFGRNHVDFVPMGDMVCTLGTLIQGSPKINFRYEHHTARGSVRLYCAELRGILGENISLNEPPVLAWIEKDLRKQYSILL